MADFVLQNGMIYDGSGTAPYQGDIAIEGDQIVALGAPGTLDGATKIDVSGLAVAPGFINMLSWSVESLIYDGKSQSEIRQGVTLEVMGEGTSMGPLSEEMRADATRGILGNRDIEYEIEWTTLGEYLEYLEKRGVSTNVASFVGSSTLRVHEVGYDDRPATPEELERMAELVRQAMREGAMGMSAALIYPPASYASTEELIALAKAVSEYDGMYITHLRSEGWFFVQAVEEMLRIAREANVWSEIYHLKAAGRANWHKMDEVIALVEKARADRLHITADMYMYPAGGTGLNACIPPWAHSGGDEAMLERLRDPEMRAKIIKDMTTHSDDWENMWLEAEGPDKILLAGFNRDELKPLTGKTLAEVAAMRGTEPIDTLIDLLLEDDGRIFTMYFTMSEDNIRKQVQLPWVSFDSDAESMAPEGAFLKSNPHPRAYGNFARVLGHYVRDEGLVTLEDAIHRLTTLPATNLKIKQRGALKPTYFADVVVFDPATIADRATFADPHQYSVGMKHVFVNGQQVLKDGEHTGAKPGRVVRGPGWTGHAREDSGA
jgi:N-acyl-D-amino-acid deacylase